MRKNSALNVLLLLLSLVGAAAAFIFGEALLGYVAYLPYWVQCGVYLLFVTLVGCLVMFVSETIHTGQYTLKQRKEFKQTALKAALIFLPAAVALGMLTQFLYGLVSLSGDENPDFQGTMIVCDVSGSMMENDPDRDAVTAVQSYLDTVPKGEYVGIIAFSDQAVSVREYAPLLEDDEREELKALAEQNMTYYGGTDIQSALIAAIDEMRTLEDKDWPGLIMLFSDGQSVVDYDQLLEASLGDDEDVKQRIPVNTIYYASDPLGGYQMSTIAQKTGGAYFYMGLEQDGVSLRDAFTHSRSLVTVEQPHLIQSYFGPMREAPVRILLQGLFLVLWGVFSGVLVVVFLNNNRLIPHYLYVKIGVSVAAGVALTLILLTSDADMGMTARAVLAVSMCTLYLPTYRWD
jgi:Ca-activated chloride channel family protein